MRPHALLLFLICFVPTALSVVNAVEQSVPAAQAGAETQTSRIILPELKSPGSGLGEEPGPEGEPPKLTDPEIEAELSKKFSNNEERVKHGDELVEKALVCMEKQEFSKFNLLLRHGVARSPGNIKGRIYLAQLNSIFGRQDLALKTYEEGIPHLQERFPNPTKDDLDFIRSYLQFLFYENRDREILELAKKILPATPEKTDLYLMTAYAAAQASFLRTDYQGSERYLTDYGIEKTEEGFYLRSEIRWTQGKKSEAVDLLKEAIKVHPSSPRLFSQLISLYRRQDDHARALRYSTWFANVRPLDPKPRVEIITDLHKLGKAKEAEEEIERFLSEFDKKPDGLQLLANFATDTGNHALAHRLYQIALEKGYRASVFALLCIEAEINAKRHREAAAFCDRIQTENAEWLKEPSSTFFALRAVVAFGLEKPEEASRHLELYLTEKKPSDRTCLMIVKRFREFGMMAGAKQMLAYGRKTYPKDQSLVANVLEIALDEKDGPTAVASGKELLELRKPSEAVLNRTRKALASEAFKDVPGSRELIAEIDAHLLKIKLQDDSFRERLK